MRFSINDPIRLLRKLHGLNPKAKTHFVVRIISDQMEMAPPFVSKEGKDPNEKEIHGDTKEALLRLAETLAFYSLLPYEVELVTTRKVSNGSGTERKKIELKVRSQSWQAEDFLAALSFLAPDNVEWKLDVRFDTPQPLLDTLWAPNPEVRRLLQQHPAISRSLRTLKQGNLVITIR
jgi:hypothetical protein